MVGENKHKNKKNKQNEYDYNRFRKKEIMVEMLIELKRIDAKLDSIERTICIYGN